LALADLAVSRPEIRKTLDDGSVGHKAAADTITKAGWTTSEASIRRWREKHEWVPFSATIEPAPEGWGKQYEIGPETGTVCSGPVEKAVTDPNELLEIWNLDPETIEIVGLMTVKAWEVDAKAEVNGEVVIITKRLFSYKANIRKRALTSLSLDLLDSWRTSLQTQTFVPTTKAYGDRLSYVVLIADPQLGKERTSEAKENWERGVLGHAEAIQRLVDGGANVEVVVSFMGDEVENVANNYTNQSHTIELNLTEQLSLDFDMSMWSLKTLLPLGHSRKVTSVRSNHGEWTRNGSKDVVTTKADNASTFIREQTQKTFEYIDGFADVEWLIGNEGPHVLAELSGIKCFFSHFYEQRGKGGSGEIRTKNAIERQILGRTEELGDVKIFFTAHFHHFYGQEFEGRQQWGCPALEAERSSGYMLNNYGVWSPPGLLGMAVGRDLGSRGWGNLNIY
jgi:hypothetical protein